MGSEVRGRSVRRGLPGWVLAVAVAVAVLASCSAEDEVPAEGHPCERLREHMIDLRIEGTPAAEQAGHREVMRRALGDAFLETCATTMSPAQIRCALDARDSAAAASCSTSATR